MKQVDAREGARRQHRAVSLFAVVQCWLRGLDGVVFQRRSLERLLGLKRFKQTRVDWLRYDLKELFPYQSDFYTSSSSFHSLFVCRLPIDEFLTVGSMTTVERLEKMSAEAPRLEMFKIWSIPRKKELEGMFDGIAPFFADAANFDERFLSSYLSLLVQGQISPRSLPPLRSEER